MDIRIELINWALENMRNPDIQICNDIDSRGGKVVLKINYNMKQCSLLSKNTDRY